ncbi:hypothetical protein BKA70DRAFT_250339 [Coprinopsis sp. MPI-PUGE-AT-0042]|nr:hypothetical protein BKA70DRAFT_250339 [Coprinopsis sp. MPI-PUGE-AT-0042]
MRGIFQCRVASASFELFRYINIGVGPFYIRRRRLSSVMKSVSVFLLTFASVGYGWRLKLNEVTVSTPSISTISTTARPPPTLDIPDPRVGAPLYGQCGGTGWTGPDFCQSNYLCIWVNEWYSHCLLPECRDKGPYCQSELEQWVGCWEESRVLAATVAL